MTLWIQQQKGWFTSDLGGICREHDGWYFWPRPPGSKTVGPFKTADEAKQQAETA